MDHMFGTSCILQVRVVLLQECRCEEGTSLGVNEGCLGGAVLRVIIMVFAPWQQGRQFLKARTHWLALPLGGPLQQENCHIWPIYPVMNLGVN